MFIKLFMYNVNMPYYDRTDFFEGMDIDKISASKECHICHFWYFLDKWFRFQPVVCSRCHDVVRFLLTLTIMLF